MKKYSIFLSVVALALLFGCCPDQTPNTTVYPGLSHQFEKVSWNGHVYVCRTWGQQGGMTHDPDCPCKEAKKEEHIYENPGR